MSSNVISFILFVCYPFILFRFRDLICDLLTRKNQGRSLKKKLNTKNVHKRHSEDDWLDMHEHSIVTHIKH